MSDVASLLRNRFNEISRTVSVPYFNIGLNDEISCPAGAHLWWPDDVSVRMLRPLQALPETAEGGTLHVEGNMGVGVHGVRDLVVAEDLLHDLWVLALL